MYTRTSTARHMAHTTLTLTCPRASLSQVIDDDAQQALRLGLSRRAAAWLERAAGFTGNDAEDGGGTRFAGSASSHGDGHGKSDDMIDAAAELVDAESAPLNAKKRRKLARIAVAQARIDGGAKAQSVGAGGDGSPTKLSSQQLVTLVWSLAKLRVVAPATGDDWSMYALKDL